MRKYTKIPKNLGKRIKQLRNEKDLTQEDLAEIVGVSPAYIGFIEQKRRVPSIKTGYKIARALGVKFSELFD